MKNAGSHFLLSELPNWAPFPAVLRGKVRLEGSRATNPVAVGDRVRYEAADGTPSEGRATRVCHPDNRRFPGTPDRTKAGGPSWGDGGVSPEGELPRRELPPAAPAVITEVLDRNNYVIRRSTNLSRESHVIAANIDRAFIIVTLYFPEIKLQFLDRILVMCGVFGVPVSIVLNKVDLYREEAAEQVRAFHDIYEGAGYEVIDTSARTGEGIDTLRRRVKESGVCLFSGESGVGKSSLIKALDPSLDPKVGQISDAHLQGKHTTSLYEMYPLRAGDPYGFIIDSPGIRGFGLVHLEKDEIARYFPEMLNASENCRFVPCTHTHEPDCAVKQAVDEGRISAERYASYLGMLEEEKKFR